MKVLFMPGNKEVEVNKESILLEVAKEHGIWIESPCGGNYMCGKCKVFVTKGNDGVLLPEELRFLTEEEIGRGMRLACCCKVKQDMTVMVPRVSSLTDSMQRLEGRSKRKETSLGIAIDVGTTTVEAHIIDLTSYAILKKVKFYNPQIAYGADVIARITYAANNEKREEALREVLLLALNEKIKEALADIGAEEREVKEVILVGNTTMSYILAKTPLASLAKAPFTLSYKGNKQYRAKEFGLLPKSNARIYIGPNIGGHVGSDAFACLVAADLMRRSGRYLIVDVGTNGEILLVDHGKIYACSTAAGPAFEGAGLSYGMRADSGAITKAAVKEGKLVCQVAGNTQAVGISGSGIIDILAGMLELQMMEDTGYLKEEYCLAKGYEVAKNVFVSREDIRQIQLAKAAIYAGIMSLLKMAAIEAKELDQLYLAGAFGSNLDIVNAMKIGLLPKLPVNKVQYVGNAAIMGAKECLKNPKRASEAAEESENITHVELANLEGFQQLFIHSINFRSNLF